MFLRASWVVPWWYGPLAIIFYPSNHPSPDLVRKIDDFEAGATRTQVTKKWPIITSDRKIIIFGAEKYFRVVRSLSYFIGMEYPLVPRVLRIWTPSDNFSSQKFMISDRGGKEALKPSLAQGVPKSPKSSIFKSKSTLKLSVRPHTW